MHVTVTDKDSVTLFYLDFMPHVGLEIYYTLSSFLVEEGTWTEDTLTLWRSLEGKKFVVTQVQAEVRNSRGMYTSTVWATVEEVTK